MSFNPKRTFTINGQNQRDVCRALGCVGILEDKQATKNFGRENLDELSKNGLIQSFNSYDNGKINKIYHLTDKGKKYTRKHLVYGVLYRWNKLQIKHDKKLGDVYLSLSKQEQKSWRNESQIRKFSNEQVYGVDASYTSEDGKSIAVEVVTNSYSAKTFKEKVEVMKDNFDGVKIKFA